MRGMRSTPEEVVAAVAAVEESLLRIDEVLSDAREERRSLNPAVREAITRWVQRTGFGHFEARASAFAKAAQHLEEHAVGYENSAEATDTKQVHPEWRRRDEAIAYNLREKAAQIRLMK